MSWRRGWLDPLPTSGAISTTRDSDSVRAGRRITVESMLGRSIASDVPVAAHRLAVPGLEPTQVLSRCCVLSATFTNRKPVRFFELLVQAIPTQAYTGSFSLFRSNATEMGSCRCLGMRPRMDRPPSPTSKRRPAAPPPSETNTGEFTTNRGDCRRSTILFSMARLFWAL